MKRTALKRKTPIARGAPMQRRPMRRKRGSTSYSRRDRDMPRMGWCKTLPCLLSRPSAPFIELWHGPSDLDPCRGPVEAHHAGEHAGWQKPPDDTVLPLCDHHHDDLTDRRGVFAGWPKLSLKAWELAAVAHCQALYASHMAGQDDALF